MVYNVACSDKAKVVNFGYTFCMCNLPSNHDFGFFECLHGWKLTILSFWVVLERNWGRNGEKCRKSTVFFSLLKYAENTLKTSTLNFNTSFCWSHTDERRQENGIWLLSSKTSETFPTDFALKSNRKYHSSRLPIINIVDSGQNSLYTTFPNISLLISTDQADLSLMKKNHFSKKSMIFYIENVL